jgi:MYXO-CTERM domain-containing protein
MIRLPLAVLLPLLLIAPEAHAYKWYYNADNKPLHQFGCQVPYYIDGGDLDFVEEGVEDATIQAAMGVWNSLDSDLEFVYAGTAQNAEAAFYGDPALDENHIVFVPTAWTSSVPWQHENAIALTTLSFVKATGEIVDADIRLNNTLYYFAHCASAPEEWSDYQDLFYVVLHEAGHMTGLDHSSDELSVMYVQKSTCADEPLNTLTPDDQEGFLSFYGTPEYATLCAASMAEPETVEERGEVPEIVTVEGAELLIVDTDKGPKDPDCGCRVQTGATPGTGVFVLLILVGFLLLILRARPADVTPA